MAMVMVLTFLPAVSAMLICEVDCIASVLVGGDGHGAAQTDQAGADSEGNHGSQDHLKDAGPCHLAATPIIVGSGQPGAAAGLFADPWLSAAMSPFASVNWPPPRPRPKLTLS